MKDRIDKLEKRLNRNTAYTIFLHLVALVAIVGAISQFNLVKNRTESLTQDQAEIVEVLDQVINNQYRIVQILKTLPRNDKDEEARE